jgi:protein-tyrosine-phosphatase
LQFTLRWEVLTMNASPSKDPRLSLLSKVIMSIALVGMMTATAVASGPQYLSPEVHEALRAVAAGNATPRQEAILFANNDAINKARLARQIPDTQYQASQNRYKQMNQDFAAKAAKKVGAEFEVQTSKATRSQPGTDSDYITKVKSGQQIQDMQADYNRQVNEYLQKHKVTSVDRADWHNKLDTDFMADPKGVSQAEFERIAEMNNDAYSRRRAAAWEYKSRNPEAGPISQRETRDYVEEMEDFRNKKKGQIEDLQRRGDIERGTLDEGKLIQKQAQQQKYDSRIGEADARYRADHGLSEADNRTQRLAKDGAIREPDVTPEKARELLGKGPKEKLTAADMETAQRRLDARRQAAYATEENIHRNAKRSAAEGIMEKAKLDAEVDDWMRQQGLSDADAPRSFSKNAARDAAAIMENMPASEKGRFLQGVEDSLPRDPNTGRLTPSSQQIMDDLRAEMRKRPGKPPGRQQAPDGDTAKVSEPEGPKVTEPEGPKVTDPDGPKVADADGPRVTDVDGPKVADVDGPKVGDMDGPKVKVADVDAPKSNVRGALQKAGEVMTGVDVLNTGQDIVDYMDGKKSAGEVAGNAAINFTPPGQVYAAASAVDKKSRDYGDAEFAADEVNRALQQAHAVESGLAARRQGATREEAQAIMIAIRSGFPDRAEQMAQGLRDRGIDFHIPKAPDEYEVEADDTAWERTGQVAEGIGHQIERAGNFLWDTAKNVHEIRTAPDSIMQDKIHEIKEGWKHDQQAQDLFDRLVSKGADPEDARTAVEEFKKGNFGPLADLRRTVHQEEGMEEVADAVLSPEGEQVDELADAMLAAADTPEDIAASQSGRDVTRSTRHLTNQFSGTDATGLTDRERESNTQTLVSLPDQALEKEDIHEVMDAQRTATHTANQSKAEIQREAQTAYTSAWQATISGVNATIAQLNRADATKVQQKTEEAIALIQQMQSGTINDEEFTTQLTKLENESAALDRQAQAAWQTIRDQLIHGQVNNGNANTGMNSATGNDAANQILTSVPPDQVDQRFIVCDTQSKSGANTPASISVDMKGGTGTATLSYSFYSVKDRILVQVNGNTICDTGCRGGSESVPIPVSGGDQVRVIVQPACDGSSTRWNFSVSCPKQSF